MSDKQNIHIFFGEDKFQLRQKLKIWRNEFKKKYEGDLNLVQLDSKDLPATDIIEAIETIPFLSEKKLVVVNNFLDKAKDPEQQKLLKYLDKPIAEHAILVFVEEEKPDKRRGLFKKIHKIGNSHEFKYMSPEDMARFLHERSKGLLAINAAKYLIFQTGSELWRSEKELEKLLIFSDGQNISQTMIDDMVTPTLSASIFKLTDQVATKKAGEAIKTLNILIESGEDPYRILFMIVRQFRIILQVKDLLEQKYDRTHIIKTLKLHPFVAMTTMEQSRNFSFEELKRIYKALLKIDIDIKSGNIRISPENKAEFCLELSKVFI